MKKVRLSMLYKVRILKKVNVLLVQLLNDPSFMAWLHGNGTTSDIERWEKWLNEGLYKKQIETKARKLYSMPFAEVHIDYNHILGELEKLKDQLGILRLRNITQ